MAVTVTIATAGIQGASGNSGSDGTDATSSPSTLILFDDFISNTYVGNIGWSSTSVSGGSASIASSESNHSGIVSLTTGASDASAYSSLFLGSNTIFLGNGVFYIECLLRLPTLSAVDEEYVARFGLGDVFSGDNSDGIWFEYNRLSSVNWLMCVNNGTTAVKTASSTAVAANTWIKLKIQANAAADTITYYVDGTSIGTKTSGFSTSGFAPRLNIIKSAGTSARLLHVDYFSLNYTLTTSR